MTQICVIDVRFCKFGEDMWLNQLALSAGMLPY